MICAALCFHDEPPAMLRRCVESLAGLADVLVALDGRWEGFEHPLAYEPAEQWAAIHDAADLVSIAAGIGGIGLSWSSQIEKRDVLMRTASHWGEWVLVVDADDYIERFDPSVHQLLSETDLDVASIHARYWIGARETSRPVRRLFRTAVGLNVTGAHNGYRADDGRWLHAPTNVTTEDALDLTDQVKLTHDASPRTRSRQEAMQRYYAFRAANREETLREQEPACVTA